KLASKFPGTTQSTSYGTPALKANGKLFARLKEDGETLVLRTDPVSRDLMLAGEPDLFYITDHYRDWPWILLRLTRVTERRLGEPLEAAWRLAAPRGRRAPR